MGFQSYWLSWCSVLPLLLVGTKNIKSLLRPHKPNPVVVLLVLFPVGMAARSKLVPGMVYGKQL